jgi:hypothetical protein
MAISVDPPPPSIDDVDAQLLEWEKVLRGVPIDAPIFTTLVEHRAGVQGSTIHSIAFGRYQGQWRLLEVKIEDGQTFVYEERPLGLASHGVRAEAVRRLPRLFEAAVGRSAARRALLEKSCRA